MVTNNGWVNKPLLCSLSCDGTGVCALKITSGAGDSEGDPPIRMMGGGVIAGEFKDT